MSKFFIMCIIFCSQICLADNTNSLEITLLKYSQELRNSIFPFVQLRASSLDEYLKLEIPLLTKSNSLINSYRLSEYYGIKRLITKNKVKIAVIDGGFDCNNPDIMKIMISCDHVFKNGNKVKNMKINEYRVSHGTNVVGIIQSINDNIEVFGIAIDSSVKSSASAIRLAVNKNVKLINISMSGGLYASKEEMEAIKYAYSKGVMIITCAGNEKLNTSEFNSYPSSFTKVFPNVISVGGMNIKSLYNNSNYGNLVDIYTSFSVLDITKNYHRVMRGTSFSAPVITGLLSYITQDYTPHAMKSLLKKSSREVYDQNTKSYVKKAFDFDLFVKLSENYRDESESMIDMEAYEELSREKETYFREMASINEIMNQF